MNKRNIILVLIMICCLSACGNDSVNKAVPPVVTEYLGDDINDRQETDNFSNGDENEMETSKDEMNRTIIAKALGIAEDNRNMRFILASLDAICAGQIQSAEAVEFDGKGAIDLVAEDGTNYRIHLLASGSVDAVENMDTGEWPIRSVR